MKKLFGRIGIRSRAFYFALVFSILLFARIPLMAESFEFVDQEISEILYAVSLYRGFPINADDSVSGKADFRFAGGNFDEAFDSFLRSARLYVEKGEKSWVVSRIRVLENADGNFALDAFDVNPGLLLEKTGIALGVFISHDGLPQIKVSIHTGFCSAEEIVERIASLCSGFFVEKDKSDGKKFKVVKGGTSLGGTNRIFFEKCEFSRDDASTGQATTGTWKCDVQNATLSSAVEKLCVLAGKQFSIVSGGDGKIVRSNFGGKSFEEMLKLLCLQGGSEVVFSNGVYFIAPLKDARNRLSSSARVWKEAELDFAKGESVVASLGKRFPALETFCSGSAGNGVVLFRVDESEEIEVRSFIKKLDTPLPCHLVQLKYLKTSDFFEHLPPFLEKASVFDSGNGNSFYFSGTDENYKRLLERLPEFDKPVTTITYDLLIMQYQKSNGSDWTPSFSGRNVKLGDRTELSGELGSVLDLSLDVVSAFGLTFAANLQAAISETKAKVFADTTLHGVSGSTINFQNLNTYRYRDNNLDPDTGKPIYSGVTKEISSGLKLEVTGFVSGDGMITSKITASVSRQGEDSSSKTGNPPPTSEKVITTEVRCRSGEPVILSGLVQDEDSEQVSRTPILSKIPILGWFFKAKNKKKEKTELVIYLVPQAEIFNDEQNENKLDVGSEMKRLYEKFTGEAL